eukprot:CAMPEP_0172499576 /NCGR_PEP_ID=MMETSP1066-20121228/128238_1 /TAXON_ID=671091 /ORGANISM="Coscinodiscus wailesii, Strain CCMP2513" /LENGTH=310 /DNA_ID=CAMNT_0013273367 /DNA_START=219 /DNA_END=1151 /DNA_ORIENTATION=+
MVCGIKFLPWTCLSVLCGIILLYGSIGDRTFRTRVKGSSVLVTGAGSGLGRAFSIEAAKRGSLRIVLVGRREQPLSETLELIRKVSPAAEVFVRQLDIGDDAAVKRVCGDILSDFGAPPDIIINNAGMGDWKHIEDTSPEECRRMTSVPYFGAHNVTSAFAPAMIERGSGHFLNVTSLASVLDMRCMVSYQVARAAMRMFSYSLREDLMECSIGVTCLNAGELSGTEYFVTNKVSLPWIFTLSPISALMTMSVEEVAAAALDGVEAGEVEVVTPAIARLLLWLLCFVPDFVRAIFRLGDVGRRDSKKKSD